MKTKTIGILIERQRAYGRRLCEGIVRFAKERGDWSLRIIEFGELAAKLRKGRYDGIIARVMNDRIADALLRVGCPVVDVFCEKPMPSFGATDQDADAVGQMAAQHFIEHKFTQFAFCGYDGRTYSDMRFRAFERTLGQNHFKCLRYKTPASALKDFDESVVMRERFEMPSDEKRLARWAAGLPKPIGVFCAHDMRAWQLCETCRERGIKVPDEVAILGVDDDELVCHFTSPALSSINQNAVGIGYAAAQTMQQMMSSPGTVPPQAKIKPVKLVERESTATYPLEPRWLSDALVFIRSHISAQISAQDVYAHVGKSHTLVDRAFSKSLGVSVQREILRTRLSEAKRLIVSTEMPIRMVAEKCGYSSLQYFSASFVRAFGANPTSVRASIGYPR